MNTIENWISLNNWEILILSKVLSLFFITKIYEVTQYQVVRLRKLFVLKERVNLRIIGMSLFLNILFYSLIIQFGGGIQNQRFREETLYSSFLGSVFFYLIEFLVLSFIARNFSLGRRSLMQLFPFVLIAFLLSSKVSLPYIDTFWVFLVTHFTVMYVFVYKKRITDTLIYSLLVLGPLSIFYGVDLVWENAYSIFIYNKGIPSVGIIAIWTLGVGYYLKSDIVDVKKLKADNSF